MIIKLKRFLVIIVTIKLFIIELNTIIMVSLQNDRIYIIAWVSGVAVLFLFCLFLSIGLLINIFPETYPALHGGIWKFIAWVVAFLLNIPLSYLFTLILNKIILGTWRKDKNIKKQEK
ncbi:hypothetical protein GCM10025861_24630 [Methanobacterium petrolearium]|nr:hypothetical protein GCM10025861_24630 [Methanobacterium petrolearium]